MKILVDTSIWSIALRRRRPTTREEKLTQRLEELIQENRVEIIGPIRQELLSGMPNKSSLLLRDKLRAFPDLKLSTLHFERAAEMANLCREKGVQGSHTDFLICAVAECYHLAIFTVDKDFQHYAQHVPIRLLS